PNFACLSSSANGELIAARGGAGFSVFSRHGPAWRPVNVPAHNALPTSDGQAVIDNGLEFTPAGQPTGPRRYFHGHAVWGTPALQGGLAVTLNEAYETDRSRFAYMKVMVHQGGEPEAFVTFPLKCESVSRLIDSFGRFHPLERHVF